MFRLAVFLSQSARSAFAEPAMQVAFPPGATDVVVQVIDSAKTTIRVAAYGFTSRPVVDALNAARARGVDVEIVLDKSNRQHWSAAAILQGIPSGTTTVTRSCTTSSSSWTARPRRPGASISR